MQKSIKKLLDGFFLLRIPLLAPVWTIFLLGWITGNSNSTPGGFFVNNTLQNQLINTWTILGGFSLIVASIYVVNQIADIESDRINHKLFILPNGFISVTTAWVLAIACALGGIAIAFHYNLLFVMFFLISLLIGYLYNLPPAALKNRALGGVFANAIGHGMITYLVGWYSARYYYPMNTNDYIQGFISSIGPSLANGAVFLATTVPDAQGDRSTGKITFCVKFGEKKTAIFSAFLCALALAFSFCIEYHSWVMVIPSAISVFFFTFFAISVKRELAFKSFKWPVFLLSATVALFLPEYGVLIILTFVGSRLYYKWRFDIDYPTFKAQ